MLSMMVQTAIELCAHTNVWQQYGCAVKGERYAFRATNGRGRNIVGTRFTSYNKSRNRHWRIKRHWPRNRGTASRDGELRGGKLEEYHIVQNTAAQRSFEVC